MTTATKISTIEFLDVSDLINKLYFSINYQDHYTNIFRLHGTYYGFF